MEMIAEGIAVFKNVFLRSEEVIDMAEESTVWRQGTSGTSIDPKIRITDIHDLDTKTELHKELLQTFLDGINEYKQKYTTCRVTSAEPLRVGRYSIGGHYVPHSDSVASERVLSGILYLNGDFDGGQLKFEHQDITIIPEEGMLVLFPSTFTYVHESLPLTAGKKYIVISWFA